MDRRFQVSLLDGPAGRLDGGTRMNQTERDSASDTTTGPGDECNLKFSNTDMRRLLYSCFIRL